MLPLQRTQRLTSEMFPDSNPSLGRRVVCDLTPSARQTRENSFSTCIRWRCLAYLKGILLTPKTTITERGGTRAVEGKINMSPVEVLVNLWRHECERVFCDKLTTNKARRSCAFVAIVLVRPCTKLTQYIKKTRSGRGMKYKPPTSKQKFLH